MHYYSRQIIAVLTKATKGEPHRFLQTNIRQSKTVNLGVLHIYLFFALEVVLAGESIFVVAALCVAFPKNCSVQALQGSKETLFSHTTTKLRVSFELCVAAGVCRGGCFPESVAIEQVEVAITTCPRGT
eukprot:4880156-Amphidinium_carterae.1